MEAIPEDPTRIHFFRLLELLTHNNAVRHTQVRLKPPNSLIFGFNFAGLTLMKFVHYRLQFTPVDRLEDAMQYLDLYTSETRGGLPLFILKTTTGKEFLRTRDELTNTIGKLTKRARKLYAEEFVVQPFVISKGRKAMTVEVDWDVSKGVSLVLYQNTTELNPATLRTLTISDTAEMLYAKTSQSTQHLLDTLDLVRLIIDKAVLREEGGHVRQLRIRIMQDIYENWFFLGIEKFEIARSRLRKSKTTRLDTEMSKMFSTTESLTPKAVSPMSSPTYRNSAFSHSPTVPLFNVSLKMQSSRRPQTGKSYTTLSKSRPHTATAKGVRFPPEYLKQLEIEEEVSKLISQESVRPIANMTYTSWKKRTSESHKLLLIDQIYANTICKQRHTVLKEAKATLKGLQKFREEIRSKTDEMLFQAEIAERISSKPGETTATADLSQFSRFSKLRQEKLESDYRMKLEREGVAKIFKESVEKFTLLTEMLRAARIERAEKAEKAAKEKKSVPVETATSG